MASGICSQRAGFQLEFLQRIGERQGQADIGSKIHVHGAIQKIVRRIALRSRDGERHWRAKVGTVGIVQVVYEPAGTARIN